jgi:hypothetical protein
MELQGGAADGGGERVPRLVRREFDPRGLDHNPRPVSPRIEETRTGHLLDYICGVGRTTLAPAE